MYLNYHKGMGTSPLKKTSKSRQTQFVNKRVHMNTGRLSFSQCGCVFEAPPNFVQGQKFVMTWGHAFALVFVSLCQKRFLFPGSVASWRVPSAICRVAAATSSRRAREGGPRIGRSTFSEWVRFSAPPAAHCARLSSMDFQLGFPTDCIHWFLLCLSSLIVSGSQVIGAH